MICRLPTSIRTRACHLVPLFALLLISYDALHAKSSRPSIIDPCIWLILYFAAAASVAVFIRLGNIHSLQAMTLFVSSVGMFRGITFFIDDGRLTPFGLNLLIASYAVLAHKYERGRLKW